MSWQGLVVWRWKSSFVKLLSAVSFCDEEERIFLRDIERLMRQRASFQRMRHPGLTTAVAFDERFPENGRSLV